MARRDLTGAVDFTVLERVVGGDSGVTEEILGLFVEQARLWSGLLEPGGEGWRDAAHTLRGAAAGIGAETLARACAEAETAEKAMAAPLLARVRDALEIALTDVAAYRHELMLRGLRQDG